MPVSTLSPLPQTPANDRIDGDPLDRNLFFVKEHVGFFKASSNYDILDPATGQLLMQCREPKLGFFTKLLRFTDYKRMTPFDVHITKPTGELVVQVKRGISLFVSNVQVFDPQGARLGGFRQKWFSLGGSFTVLSDRDEPICDLKGKWTGWNFRFLSGDTELASVTKQWSGLGKELFTSADNYVLTIHDTVPPGHPVRKLILGAVMTIDLVLKE